MIDTICVCGAGTMGSGIAQVCAQAGFTTLLFDVNEAVLQNSKISIEKALQLQVDRRKITPHDKLTILSCISYTSKIENCKADIIIEAIVENATTKAHLFNQLAKINSGATIFATNTSSIPVCSIASEVLHPSRVAGMHFFNPAPLMKLVEVVKAKATTEATIEMVYSLSKQLGKTPVLCNDVPGFIVNRVARHYYLEALRLLEAGVTDVKTIDTLMEATGFKMGPFKLMDLIGIDINYNVSNIVWEKLGKPERLCPSSIQREKIADGHLGKKSKKGFYVYE